MAKFRTVKTSFWTDEKVVEEFTPEDKLFFLYLLTNPRTTQLGIYEFVPKLAAFDLGYSKETVLALIERFENKYHMIRYSKETGEIAIKNYLHHSIVKGGKPVMDCLMKEEAEVKDKSLIIYIVNNIYTNNTTLLDFIEYINTIYINNNDNDNDNERIVVDDSLMLKKPCDKDIDNQADEMFEHLWKLYPKKRGKGSVSQTQKRKLLKIGLEELTRCINRYLEDKKGTDEQYLKNGSTFFNSGYIDYLDAEWEKSHPQQKPIVKPNPYEGCDKVVVLLEDESNLDEYEADRQAHTGYSMSDGYWIK